MIPNMEVEIAGVKWKNPVTVASGTFGSGMEYGEFVDLNKLGAITSKGVAIYPWEGNATPRVAETPSGMLNAIGLQNPGMEVFKNRDIPFMKKCDTVSIVNVVGKSAEEYIQAVEAAGADALSLINTLTGMKIDVERQSIFLANKTGGLSGPAIRPVAVRMVYEVAHSVNIPIIGMGGITCASDALEFILAGATAVSVGTANFNNPNTPIEVVDGIRDYMVRKNIENIKDITGIV